ncbi:hypothetical protein O181_032337 [Austropuccinia psidii MF-1]|uniref:Uncharacterized protein n=1 Tax=Austropuccinia psidii MF-1 TaxID=1389203 RepID=A0A9Q3CZA0_9BASI|nr:hypothetical protein [Austropuccinia psidii MF-1]
MPIQHSPPERHATSQARDQAVLTPNPTATLDGTLNTFKGAGEDAEEEEENSVEKEESEGTEGIPAPVGSSHGSRGPTLAQYHQPVSHH